MTVNRRRLMYTRSFNSHTDAVAFATYAANGDPHNVTIVRERTLFTVYVYVSPHASDAPYGC